MSKVAHTNNTTMARKDLNLNTVGQPIDIKKAVCREFDLNEISNFIASAVPFSWSWGFKNPETIVKKKAFRFVVNGHHHKGYVYIVLGFMDTFDIYYTTKEDVIVEISNDVYIMDLIDTLDITIEKVAEYSR